MFVHYKWYENHACKVTLSGVWQDLTIVQKNPGKMNSEGKQKQFELLGIQVIEVNLSES